MSALRPGKRILRAGSLPVVLILAAAPAAPVPGQEPDAAPVSRQEVEALRNDVETLKARLAGLDSQPADLEGEVRRQSPGSTGFLLAGDAAVGFASPRHAPSSFEAGFSPLVLVQVTDRILLEAALDFSLTNDLQGGNPQTQVDLALASLSYRINDYLTAGGGKFVLPFGAYHASYDPSWINRLPDDPLPFADGGLAPNTGVGVFLQGAAPIGRTRINYALHVTNGPVLVTDDPAAAGSLTFDNFIDSNGNKAVGGRLGFLPVPELELGYAFLTGRVGPHGWANTSAFLQAVDLNYARVAPEILGKVICWAAWVRSDVGRAVYDPDGSLGFGPLSFDNVRDGVYLLLAYRPTLCGIGILRDLEFVVRYEAMAVSPEAPGGGWERRWTPGLDCWLTPSAVLKVAYEFDRRQDGGGANAFLFQFGLGF